MPASTGGAGFRAMLRPDLPKENVDGEAVEWAADRLRRRPEGCKVLIVLSDGAPVDDSTLSTNAPTILEDHLKQVVGAIESGGDVKLAALGVGFDVGRYYANAATVETADDLGRGLISLLESALIAEPEAAGRITPA